MTYILPYISFNNQLSSSVYLDIYRYFSFLHMYLPTYEPYTVPESNQ